MRFYVDTPSSPIFDISYPAVLLQRDNWDDFGYKTTFTLIVVLDSAKLIEVGAVKILRIDQRGGPTPLAESFDVLDSRYCSLGQSLSYYQTLRHLGESVSQSVMRGLRDVVLEPWSAERFRENRGFSDSLERFGSSNRLLTEAAPLFRSPPPVRASGLPLSFLFATSVGGTPFEVRFSFNEVADIPGRINALIGYNGTGKTRLLGNLAMVAHRGPEERDRAEFRRRHGEFRDLRDLTFGKVVTVSYSAFDTFEVPGATPDQQEQMSKRGDLFGYVYVGLRSFADASAPEPPPDRPDRLKSPAEISEDFERAVIRASTEYRRDKIRDAISEVLNEPSFLRLGVDTESLFDQHAFAQFDKLSTGHKIVLNIVLQLAAHLEPRSLVLIDEPESHLHPPLLSALLRSLSNLLESYDSIAVVATHSPVVLQEVPRRYVRILRRFGDVTEVDAPDYETFGENVGFLTRSVFSLDTTASDHHSILRRLAQRFSIAQIEEMLGNPMSPQARAYVASIQSSMR